MGVIKLALRRQPHPLCPRWKSVVNLNSSAVLVAGQLLAPVHHRHGAARLVPRVLPVKGVTYWTRGLDFEKPLDALGAERVATLQRSLPLNRVQADDAVLAACTGLATVPSFHYCPA